MVDKASAQHRAARQRPLEVLQWKKDVRSVSPRWFLIWFRILRIFRHIHVRYAARFDQVRKDVIADLGLLTDNDLTNAPAVADAFVNARLISSAFGFFRSDRSDERGK